MNINYITAVEYTLCVCRNISLKHLLNYSFLLNKRNKKEENTSELCY
jgi:hypothetical protein